MYDQWFKENCMVDPGVSTQLCDLFASWVQYVDKIRHVGIKRDRDLSAWLTTQGFEKYRAADGMMMRGIALNAVTTSKPTFFKPLQPRAAEEWIVQRCAPDADAITSAQQLRDDLYLWSGSVYDDETVDEWLQRCGFEKIGESFKGLELSAITRKYHNEIYARWFHERCARTDVNDSPVSVSDLAASFRDWDEGNLEPKANVITIGVWLTRQKLPYAFKRQHHKGNVYHGIRLKRYLPLAGWV